jgi:hypothetical protein
MRNSFPLTPLAALLALALAPTPPAVGADSAEMVSTKSLIRKANWHGERRARVAHTRGKGT